ncbi:MAG TPA: hypothetical protein VM056_05965 [Terriglobales bacterium]|nr:hypothetical protein [Terriglobales bacterium]
MAARSGLFILTLLPCLAAAQAPIPPTSGTAATVSRKANSRHSKGAAAKPSLSDQKNHTPPATAPLQGMAPIPAPQVPLRPSQMPSVSPRVSFQSGLLTIVAENSTMADVISQVRAATGVKIETMGGPSGERIAVKIGPAPLRDVILSLVQGSQYDFFILGVEGRPEEVSRVILTPKVAGGNVSASSSPRAGSMGGNAVYQPPPDENEEDGNEGFAVPEQPQPTPIQPANQPNANPGAPKTPEQLLEELRRMEQQRNNPQVNPRDRSPRN